MLNNSKIKVFILLVGIDFLSHWTWPSEQALFTAYSLWMRMQMYTKNSMIWHHILYIWMEIWLVWNFCWRSLKETKLHTKKVCSCIIFVLNSKTRFDQTIIFIDFIYSNGLVVIFKSHSNCKHKNSKSNKINERYQLQSLFKLYLGSKKTISILVLSKFKCVRGNYLCRHFDLTFFSFFY